MSAGRGCLSIFGMVFLAIVAIGILSTMAGAVAGRVIPLAMVFFLGYLVWKIVSPKIEALSAGRAEMRAARPPAAASAGTSRDGRVKQIKKSIPANEPIRATLITVVEEAIALRGMSDRIANYPFMTADVAQSLHPEELRRKSDDAIMVALDLSGRLQIILDNSKGRPRSQRAAAALSAQQVRMEHLRDALIYSRDAIEEMILTHGEAPGTTDRLARGLRNLTDAIDESYSDPLDTKIAALSPTGA